MHSFLYIFLLVSLFIGLSINVIKGRNKLKVALLDGHNFTLNRSIRAQANFSEYTPLFLIMLCWLEVNGTYVWAIHLMGASFLLGRIFHAYSLLISEKYSKNHKLRGGIRPRIAGMVITFSVLFIQSFMMFIQFFISL